MITRLMQDIIPPKYECSCPLQMSTGDSDEIKTKQKVFLTSDSLLVESKEIYTHTHT